MWWQCRFRLKYTELTWPYFATHLKEPYKYVARDVDTLSFFGETLQGPMHCCYERFMESQPDRNIVTWQMVKNHLCLAYLKAVEQEYLKLALEKTCQRT